MKKILAVAVVVLMCQLAIPCTIFNVTEGSRTLVGGNLDNFYDAEYPPSVQFIPASQGENAVMVVLSSQTRMQGMNDQGLFFDMNTVCTSPRSVADPFKIVPDPYGVQSFNILKTCSNVQDVLAYYDRISEPVFGTAQLQWVDASGASVVCGFDHDEDQATSDKYSYVLKSGSYQVSTNFNLLQHDIPQEQLNWSASWDRYKTAVTQLNTWTNPGIGALSYILNLTKQMPVDAGGQIGWTGTLYSYVADLSNGDVYFHYHHNNWPDAMDFDNIAKINAFEEWEEAEHTLCLDPNSEEDHLPYYPKNNIITDPVPFPYFVYGANKTLGYNATTIQPSSNLELDFNRSMCVNTGGNVTIKEYDTDATVETININNVSGLGTNQITINPSQNLAYNTRYYILIDPGCLKTCQGQTPEYAPYHGMPAKTSLRFKTAAQ